MTLRSWLFTPGDALAKIEKAPACGAAAFCDLRRYNVSLASVRHTNRRFIERAGIRSNALRVADLQP
jgi:hypothetical protein